MSRSVSGEYVILMALCLQILQAELLLIRSKHFTEDCTVLRCLYKPTVQLCAQSTFHGEAQASINSSFSFV